MYYTALIICLTLCLQNHVKAIKFEKQPSDTTAKEGADNVILECKVDEKSAKLDWYKDGQIIQEDYIHLTKIGDGLRIDDVVRSDGGVYYCQAEENGAILTSKSATLTVKYICKGSQFDITPSQSKFYKGDAVTLTCGCDGFPEPTYEWKKDGQQIATGKDFKIASGTASDDGEYTCSATNGVEDGSPYVSKPYDLVVIDGAPPKITVKPESRVYFKPNSEVMIKCQAIGDPVPDIVWYLGKDTTPLTNTTNRHIFNDGSLHFNNVATADAGAYYCQAKNLHANSEKIRSKLVQAKIGSIPKIDEQLFGLGSPISIRCLPPKAQPEVNETTWRHGDGQEISLSDPRVKSVKNTLTIEQTKKSDSGTYECVAKNMAGEKTLKVVVKIAVYPKVVESPQNQTVIEGKMATFQCKVTGDPAPTIAWLKDGVELTDSVDYQVNGATLTITKVKTEDRGSYRCTATLDKISEQSEVAQLKVRERIMIIDPGSVKLDAAKDGKIICLVTGEKPWNITWFKVGLGKGLLSHMQPEGHILHFRKPKLTDSGNYTCQAQNSFSRSSTTISVNVYRYPVFLAKPKNATVKMNGSVLFNCSVKGYPEPTVLWYRRNKKGTGWEQLQNDKRFKIYNNGSLFLRNVGKDDQLEYKCVGGNAGELIIAAAHLKIDKGGKAAKNSSGNMGKTVGIAVGCAGAYIILVVGLMIYCKRRRANQAKNKLVINGEDIPLNAVDGENVEVVKAPNSELQFPRQDLEALRTLGSGSYGNVFLAKAPGIVEGEVISTVVVQSLTSKDAEVKKEFVKIMEKLSLKHENIAKLLGVCREQEPVYLISEYPEQGDLKTILSDSTTTPLSLTQKLNLCASISSGMNYLTSHEHIHKDLAARNCLVDKCFNVKISFLSLNQGTYPKEYYKRGEELIPLRWMAPEALNGDYNEASDVWSFGVVMWEIYSGGLLPYDERPDEEVLKCVAFDLRLTKPEKCPGKIFKLMEQCWEEEANNRPSFGHLCEDFSEMPRDNEL